MKWNELETLIIEKTENLLTWRKRRKLVKKEKQKRKSQIVDWVQALLWAACVVLVINQYFVQAYAIPTGSMEDTIIGDDRIFVDKFSYGPELVPGAVKLPGLTTPKRGEIVVFVNPKYYSEMEREISPAEELFNRLVYMLTFTLVNRDVKPNGEIAHHFLVKRMIGVPEDQLRMRNGRVQIKAAFESEWENEDQLQAEQIKRSYQLQKKLFPFNTYDIIKKHAIMQSTLASKLPIDPALAGLDEQYARVFCYMTLGPGGNLDSLGPEEVDIRFKSLSLYASKIPNVDRMPGAVIDAEYKKLMIRRYSKKPVNLANITPEKLETEYQKLILAYNLVSREKIDSMTAEEIASAFKTVPVQYIYESSDYRDAYFEDYWKYRTLVSINPYSWLSRNYFTRRELGWYIPADGFFPMGDNRDNSKDARYFGAVKTDQALGRSMFRFWPIPRIGGIE
ncbi:MAG: signal peptidase I [Spirochaetales bacterium]|nr:signal peptidase I [Spirochaetales bacterium]